MKKQKALIIIALLFTSLTLHGCAINKNYSNEIELYSKACRSGDATGCTNLGYMYNNGLGVSKDYKKAAKLFSKACKMGNASGCNHLDTTENSQRKLFQFKTIERQKLYNYDPYRYGSPGFLDTQRNLYEMRMYFMRR